MLLTRSIHLVGSIALDPVSEVYRTVGRLLGPQLRRIPDGEPGGRRTWITWQYLVLRASPYIGVDPEGGKRPTTGFPLLCLAPGISAGDVCFGELGYCREARSSYQDLMAARRRGEIPPEVRFQVCLPTPFAVVAAYCPGKDQQQIEDAYEKAMLRELESICDSIPHNDLCIQWDLCIEMVLWDRRWNGLPQSFADLEGEILTRLKCICAAVPPDVELGFHLCYGDWGAKHFIEPLDAGKLVEFANALAVTVAHPIAYIHMPVPIARVDKEFFQPMQDLHLAPSTELYLGLVHGADGVEGGRRRAAAAARYVSKFGIATECGMGRCKTSSVVVELLRTHVALTC